jgi:SAM-dependent methyltransferase
MNSKETYDKRFFKQQMPGSIKSARIYLKHLWNYMQPNSVTDVGCGGGTWLRACRELGATQLFGIDGYATSPEMLKDLTNVTFNNMDFNKCFSLKETDLVISLEVAEHLQPSSSQMFIESLTNGSHAVLFSAAYSGQGGDDHFNERPHSFWAKIFIDLGYSPFDLFRPYFWGNNEVSSWYRQNAFLYIKKSTDCYAQIISKIGHHELREIAFMDCIHPDIYGRYLGSSIGFKSHVKYLIPSFLRAIRRKIG